jgi:gamma-glutamylcyclotransferase (GGCT)/AIG2-like uncharacterized protein YtfP
MDFLFVRGSLKEKPIRNWVFDYHGLQQKSIKIISFFQPIFSLINLGQTSVISMVWKFGINFTLKYLDCLLDSWS